MVHARRLVVDAICLRADMQRQARRGLFANGQYPQVRHDGPVYPHGLVRGCQIGQRIEIAVPGKGVERYIEFFPLFMRILNRLGQCFQRKAGSALAQVQARAAGIDGVRAKMQGGTAFFKIPGRGQQFHRHGEAPFCPLQGGYTSFYYTEDDTARQGGVSSGKGELRCRHGSYR